MEEYPTDQYGDNCVSQRKAYKLKDSKDGR
jgi:hypothetical protein